MKNKHLLITLLFIILSFTVVAQHEKEALSTPPIKWRGVGQFFDNEKVVKPKRDNFTLYVVFHDTVNESLRVLKPLEIDSFALKIKENEIFNVVCTYKNNVFVFPELAVTYYDKEVWDFGCVKIYSAQQKNKKYRKVVNSATFDNIDTLPYYYIDNSCFPTYPPQKEQEMAEDYLCYVWLPGSYLIPNFKKYQNECREYLQKIEQQYYEQQ